MSWVCPECQRMFGRNKQSHECAPAMTLDEYFSTGPERERPIFDAVMAVLEEICDEPIHVEPVSVGLFLKPGRSFVELRPMTKWVALSFPMPYVIESPRIARKMKTKNRPGAYHVVNIREADEVDDQLREWLTEAYLNLRR